ncbi:metal dependent phosphohydrolase [Desulfonatronospira thiodismutans ASO3-1]|uniref:Metal dependent phosphohydrolase n=1 Tax=Desulfonatronospira thiodismutans ASO3-1 TaxID=555779 RepID=D6SRB3_9BACT|nr:MULTISPECIES: HDOD domain-containing protein [Desulfonatronospira]EFI33229.1 metal dependent phosphohydrolase [Desulfonatronospira thiodismutans ASO3-1]RQD73812.1 MAG: HDOD domain-containing protein [Desulfonatronospira sp. MSAO_Bac3]
MQDLYLEKKNRILSVKDLPTLPIVLDEVTELVQDPSSSTDQIAKVISKDQVLSAKVLKMVNSPIYGFPRRIGTIQHALVLLGFNVIRGLIISTSVFDIMAKNMMGLWEHSLGCATACAGIAKQAGLKDPEEYSVAGLLHDLGKLVSIIQLPEIKEEVDALVLEKDITYYQAEREVMGFAHDRINAWLADHWNLPLRLREGLVWHHRPKSAQHYPDVACVVHLGDFLSRIFQVGNSGDDQVNYLDKYIFKVLNLRQEDLEKSLDHLDRELVELTGFIPD